MAQPEIGDVFKDITADVQTIVRDQIELAKLEMTPKLKRAGIGVGLWMIIGGVVVEPPPATRRCPVSG